MKTITILVGVLILFSFLTAVLYIIFGQVTVRRLRKNKATQGLLGFEFVSGWDIINVAQALSIPRSWSKKLEGSPLSALYANAETLHKNTTKFDRLLAAIFYWLFTITGLAMILLVVLNSFGLFD